VANHSLDLILERRKEPGKKPQTILIPEDLIVRESTGPAPQN